MVDEINNTPEKKPNIIQKIIFLIFPHSSKMVFSIPLFIPNQVSYKEQMNCPNHGRRKFNGYNETRK